MCPDCEAPLDQRRPGGRHGWSGGCRRRRARVRGVRPHVRRAVRLRPGNARPRRRRGGVMRIAQVAALFESVPPALYGGTERVIAALCDELVDAGPRRDLVRSGFVDHQGAPRSLRDRAAASADEPPGDDRRRAASASADAGRDLRACGRVRRDPFSRRLVDASVRGLDARADVDHAARATRHRLEPAGVPAVSRRCRWFRSATHNASRSPGFNSTGSRPCRTACRSTPTSPQPRAADPDCFAFVGRISHEKRPDLAIEIARRTGHRLRIAAKVDPFDLEYYESTDRTTDRRDRDRVRGRDQRAREARVLRGRASAVVPERLAGAVRPGDDRVARRGNAGDRPATRFGARGPGRRRHRLHLRRRRRDGRRGRSTRRDRSRRVSSGCARLQRRAMCRRYLDAYASLRQRRLPILAAV